MWVQGQGHEFQGQGRSFMSRSKVVGQGQGPRVNVKVVGGFAGGADVTTNYSHVTSCTIGN